VKADSCRYGDLWFAQSRYADAITARGNGIERERSADRYNLADTRVEKRSEEAIAAYEQRQR
jgi:hypothetical protein